MIRQLPIYLATAALLSAPLLAQESPRREPPPGAPADRPQPVPGTPPRDRGPRDPAGDPRDGGAQNPPPRADGERPRPPLDPNGPNGRGDGPGGNFFQRDPRGGNGPRPQGPPPGGPDGDDPFGGPPGERGDRPREGFGRMPGLPGQRENQPERVLKPTAYIGVITATVPPALGAQLGLREGFGLVVEDVLPDSPAKTAGLQKHDVLKLVNDQQLAEPAQLSALLRSFGKDTEISVTLIRKSQEQKISVKIAEKMLPERRPVSDLQRQLGGFGAQLPQRDSGDGQRAAGRGQPGMRPGFEEHLRRYREDMQGYQQRLREWQKNPSGEIPPPPPIPEVPQASNAPAGADGTWELASTSVISRGRMAMKDNDGELEITATDGQRVLTAKNAAGETVFTGPVDTPAQREAVPAPFREKLNAIEARQRQLGEGRPPRAGNESGLAPFPPRPAAFSGEPEVQ